jgi:Uma2 family endonuclease
MYDLKSEDPEEPGLPDEFHDLQAQFLSLTFRPPHHPASRVFSASDMNLYLSTLRTLRMLPAVGTNKFNLLGI